MNLDVLLPNLIFHIPHSGSYIPDFSNYLLSKKEVLEEHNKLSDLGTDKIFDLGTDISSIVFPYSRIYCDVERLPDEQEEMYKYGRGFYYTKTDSGLPLRNEKDKEIVQKLYNDYHKGLTDLVRNKLENNDSCIIVDCHSFSDTPFETDLIKLKENEKRPDICIGTDEFHTPEWLIRIFTFLFEKEGFSVQINNPYSGTIVPLEFYKKDVRVKSFMIEINRKLFIDNNKINKNKINKLNKTIQKIFCYL